MNDKKKIVPVALLVLSILIITVSITYAFFQAQGGESVTRDVRIQTHTTDLLEFEIDNDIEFEVTQEEFAEGEGNIFDSTDARAILTPNSGTGEATASYYMYLNIETNEIDYSSTNTNEDPELLLQVFDSNGDLVEIDYFDDSVEYDGLEGYDITGIDGLIPILEEYEIEATGGNYTEQEWTVVITMINLDVDQEDNTGKVVEASVIISKEETTYCDLYSGVLACEIDDTFNPHDSNTITLADGYLYHHDETLTNGAGDGSYRYAGAHPNNFICFGSNAQTCPASNLYRIFGQIPVDVVTDETDPDNIITERQMLYKIIRHDYLTADVVSTGTGTSGFSVRPNASRIPSGNAYPTDGQGYFWSGSSTNYSNTWSSSTFNAALNSEYLTTLGNDANKIAKVIWKVGGGEEADYVYATPMSTVYRNEIIGSGENTGYWPPTDGKNEYAAKVGLMYVSDYGYTAPQSAWATDLWDYQADSAIYTNVWVNRGIIEWTITRCSYGYGTVFFVSSGSHVYYNSASSSAFVARPVVYLNDSAVIDFSHAGTSSDPYRIS